MAPNVNHSTEPFASTTSPESGRFPISNFATEAMMDQRDGELEALCAIHEVADQLQTMHAALVGLFDAAMFAANEREGDAREAHAEIAQRFYEVVSPLVVAEQRLQARGVREAVQRALKERQAARALERGRAAS